MNQTNFEKDWKFGEVNYIRPALEDDMKKGIDAWLGGIPFAWRKRRIPFGKYGEISIRHSRESGAKTEYRKLLDGDFKPKIYIFQFLDTFVICSTEDIIESLKNGKFQIKDNYDGTSAAYIKIEDIRDSIIIKEGG